MSNNNSHIRQQVLQQFLTVGSFTARQLNEIVGFNDSRKVISVLRDAGWDIRDYRQIDQSKVYWLEVDSKQKSIEWEGGSQ